MVSKQKLSLTKANSFLNLLESDGGFYFIKVPSPANGQKIVCVRIPNTIINMQFNSHAIFWIMAISWQNKVKEHESTKETQAMGLPQDLTNQRLPKEKLGAKKPSSAIIWPIKFQQNPTYSTAIAI